MSGAVSTASPSLALVKYWGKRSVERNIPATPSLAVTLDGLHTTTTVHTTVGKDTVSVGGIVQDPGRYQAFFDAARRLFRTDIRFFAESSNDFPTSAGLASSSSGFAALAAGCSAALGRTAAPARLSALARVGSASAARSIFGGFTVLSAGGRSASQIHPADYWPEFRIVIVITREAPKDVSSRSGMDLCRRTSPYFGAWVRDSRSVMRTAVEALGSRDLQKLGEAMVVSYSRMVATMLSSDPPFTYWLPESLSVIRELAALRGRGTGAWETMDAGPQVKVACMEGDVEEIRRTLMESNPGLRIIVSRPGQGAAAATDGTP